MRSAWRWLVVMAVAACGDQNVPSTSHVPDAAVGLPDGSVATPDDAGAADAASPPDAAPAPDAALPLGGACPAGSDEVVAEASDLPVTVGKEGLAAALPIAGPGVVTRAVVAIDLPHDYAADLALALISPLGTVVDLSSGNGGDGDGYVGTIFLDSAADAVAGGVAPFTGEYQPEQPLAGVAGQGAAGAWTLQIRDTYPTLDDGEVEAVALHLCVCFGTDGCEFGPACVDGQDDDGDGVVDCADPDCASEPRCVPETACADGVDQDLDGATDCRDADCDGHDGCELGDEVTCDDGADNDGDGPSDCADPGCAASAYCSAEPACVDGQDDDGDGVADCLDPGCDGLASCEYGAEVTCDDGLDNDGGGTTDCADADCDGTLACVVTCPAGSTATTLVAGDLPLPFGDDQTVTSTIALAGTGLITAVAVQLDIDHGYDADVDISLISPLGARELSTDNGGSGDDYAGTIFVDSADAAITSGAPPFAGAFRPEQGLSGLVGWPAAGDFTLQVGDDLAGITGTLTGYRLMVCTCDATSGDCELGAACRNGADDDGDGLVDCAEASCAADPTCQPEVGCDDDLDQDLDGAVDCLDPDCEGVAGCELGVEQSCGDGVDNDGDGLADCADLDCDVVQACAAEASCDDGLDDDGLVDCLDLGCDGVAGCEFGEEHLCGDGVDNDGDGLTDCADPVCGWVCDTLGQTCDGANRLLGYRATDLPQAISTGAPPILVESAIAVSHAGTLIDTAVRFSASHTWDADVDLTLVSPAGTTRDLTSDNGGSGDDYAATVFVDGVAASIVGQAAPMTGSFRPEQTLGVLAGESIPGTFRARLADDATGDGGDFTEFALGLCVAPPP